LTVTFDFPGQ